MDKGSILIVEDEAMLYRRLKKVLIKERYSVSDYTPSVAEAIASIQQKRPDLVLLDIDLQGELTGLDLGKVLYEKYKIPFIYVTSLDDDQTFYEGLHTHHEQFIVKTKPRLHPKEIIRAIQTVLNKEKKDVSILTNVGVLGSIDYLTELKEHTNTTITKIPVSFNNIAFFTTKNFQNDCKGVEKVKINYSLFLTKDNKWLFVNESMKKVMAQLPETFERINESTIVNFSTDFFDGRINGATLSIKGHQFVISPTYKASVDAKIKTMYLSFSKKV